MTCVCCTSESLKVSGSIFLRCSQGATGRTRSLSPSRFITLLAGWFLWLRSSIRDELKGKVLLRSEVHDMAAAAEPPRSELMKKVRSMVLSRCGGSTGSDHVVCGICHCFPEPECSDIPCMIRWMRREA